MRKRTLRRAAARRVAELACQSTSANQKQESPILETKNAAQQQQQPEPVAASSISEARLAANRANAKFSTGPTTSTGLAASSQNRTVHGMARHNGVFKLLATEGPAGFEALKQSLIDEHQPVTETESILINTMAESQWLAERAQNLQTTCLDENTGAVTNEKTFSLYLRYYSTHNRAFHKCLHDLLKLRSERRKVEIGFEAQKRKEALQPKNIHPQPICQEAVTQEVPRQNIGFEAQNDAEPQKQGFETTDTLAKKEAA
jgi:hypothetical protein